MHPCMHEPQVTCTLTDHSYGWHTRAQGSLRDVINHKSPKDHFIRKYCSRKPRGLELPAIRLHGRQILEVCSRSTTWT